MMETNVIIQGDCLEVMRGMADNSVDLCFTSPPYWQSRVYGDETCGREPHPDDYISGLAEIFEEVKRILKPTGSCYVNLGDRYFNDTGFHRMKGKGQRCFQHHYAKENKAKPDGVYLQKKQLLMLPERLAIALQNNGWIVRNKIVWQKPNAMPTPSKDRRMPTYENIYHLVKTQKYYHNHEFAKRMGQNKDIISVPIKAYKKHQATFPVKLVYPFLKLSCPKDGIVLDPFCGSGTVPMMASRNARKYIGIELSEEYCEIARKRVQEAKDSMGLFNAQN